MRHHEYVIECTRGRYPLSTCCLVRLTGSAGPALDRRLNGVRPVMILASDAVAPPAVREAACLKEDDARKCVSHEAASEVNRERTLIVWAGHADGWLADRTLRRPMSGTSGGLSTLDEIGSGRWTLSAGADRPVDITDKAACSGSFAVAGVQPTRSGPSAVPVGGGFVDISPGHLGRIMNMAGMPFSAPHLERHT